MQIDVWTFYVLIRNFTHVRMEHIGATITVITVARASLKYDTVSVTNYIQLDLVYASCF